MTCRAHFIGARGRRVGLSVSPGEEAVLPIMLQEPIYWYRLWTAHARVPLPSSGSGEPIAEFTGCPFVQTFDGGRPDLWQKKRQGCQLWLDAAAQRVVAAKPLPHFSQPSVLSWAVLCSNRARPTPVSQDLSGRALSPRICEICGASERRTGTRRSDALSSMLSMRVDLSASK